MSSENRCPQCGLPLPAHAPQGLCPACLLDRALYTTPVATGEAGPHGAESSLPTPEQLAAHFPDLEILELQGRGGMGGVYKARQKRLNRIVALKILLPHVAREAAFAQRFAREARAMAMLSHPHIVTVYEFGTTNPPPPAAAGETPEADDGAKATGYGGPLYFFLMEFVDGATLRRLLEAAKLEPRAALAIVPQICDALQYAHDRGVVHRDIKPGNILLDKHGQVKIADFGIAKLVGGAPDGALTGSGQVMGTPHYMAPEQTERPQEVDHRADIYSLGVVFYQMLTGELPLGRFAAPSKIVEIDVRLDEVVLRALEKEPEQRYQQAGEIKARVETIVTTPPATAGEEQPSGIPNWMMWNPCQSPEAREIIAHLTHAERTAVMWKGLLANGVILSIVTLVFFALSAFPRMAMPVLGGTLVLFAILTPWMLNWQRRFLCSTAWARQQGLTPDRLRLFDFGGARQGRKPVSRARQALGFVALGLAFVVPTTLLSGQLLWKFDPGWTLFGMLVPLILGVLAWRVPAGKAAVFMAGLMLVSAGPPLLATHALLREPVPVPSQPAEAFPAVPAAAGTKAAQQSGDMQAYLSETNELVRQGRYPEALTRMLWFHEHALEHEPAMTGVRLSFALSDWKNLGDVYPPARQAMTETLDKAAGRLREGQGGEQLFADAAALNRTLGRHSATVELLEEIAKKDPPLARQCWFHARDTVFAEKRYDIAKQYIPAPLADFDRARKNYDEDAALYKDPSKAGTPFRSWNENHFIGQCLQLISLAESTGDKKTAEEIRRRASAVVDDPRLRTQPP